jgi:DASH complex subunit DAD3
MDSLRELERKTALVFTLLKTSVYSMVLQQQLDMEGHDDQDDRGRHDGQEGDYEQGVYDDDDMMG